MLKKIKEMTKKRWKLISSIGLIVIIVGAVWYYRSGSKTEDVAEAATAAVTSGKISVTVSGTGSIQPSSTRNITPNTSGTITKINFKNGDIIKKGDLLFELNNDSLDSEITKARLDLEQSELTYSSQINDRKSQNITAPITGQVTKLDVVSGQDVQKNQALMEITNTSKLEFKVPFNGAQIGQIQAGQKVDVTIPALMTTIQGKVTKADHSGNAGADGTRTYNVTVEVPNLGAMAPGLEAQAVVHTSTGVQAGIEAGTLAWEQTVTVRSNGAGTIRQLYIDEADNIYKGQKLVYITTNSDDTDLKSQQLRLEQARLDLSDAQKKLADCKIYAPVDGMVNLSYMDESSGNSSGSSGSSSKSSSTSASTGTTYWQVGDQVSSNQILATIVGTGGMTVTVPVDEVDIAKVKTGQKATVTVDALPDQTFEGVVTEVASKGTESNGVASFDVTVTIDKAAGLKENMTANVEILVASKDNALLLPIEAVQDRQGRKFVILPTDSNSNSSNGSPSGRRQADGNQSVGSRSGDSQSGRSWSGGGQSGGSQNRRVQMVRVETGLYNDTMIEITSGLKEGDVVTIPSVARSSSNTGSNARGGGFGMFGGGGRPSGGAVFGGGNRSGGSGGNRSSGGSAGGNRN